MLLYPSFILLIGRETSIFVDTNTIRAGCQRTTRALASKIIFISSTQLRHLKYIIV